ncbi:MAG TPA: FkbM family methyltransferase [Chthoniobacterales bacterium]|nr:FkbM family methyltransferase [Chthoniobacterales bacterium]
MHVLKNLVRGAAAKFDYQIARRADAFGDMRRFVPASTRPVILDIGANLGQTAKKFRATFPSSAIHCFEPGTETFKALRQNMAGANDVHLWHCAVGSSVGKQTFFENTEPDMSSFLELSATGWGEVKNYPIVNVTTVDQFLTEQSIAAVDILKSDTQGYELEVFKGAEEAMRRGRIGLVYFEFIFSEMYRSLPRFDEVFRFLTDRDFLLVSIYDIHHQRNLADWANLLFVNREYHRRSGAAA